MKKLLSLVVVLVLLCGCGNTNKVTVKVEIDCSDILANYNMLDESLKDEKYVPSNGIILKETEITVDENATALDVLKAVAKENNIHIDASDGYVKGINYIYEKSCGEMSGWVYEVNNEPIMTEYTVSEGNLITWKYICDFLTLAE